MASVRAQPWTALEADNLTSLAELTEENLLKATEERYRAGLIYTAVGDILVAVNPFQELPLYDGARSRAYGTSDVSGLAPHIYRVAAAAYNAMVQGKKNQVCVISGESGAGKTESAKFIMKQVMEMCSSAGLGLKLQQKIIQLNPLLEAFGNARTELNDNSSRFGKFIQLLFESNGRIVGAGLEQYLLEKSRICVQTEKERNFHIFYYLYAGLPKEKRAQLHLKSPDQHRYLQTYCQLQTDCTSQDSRVAFSTVLESMEGIGFSNSEVEQIQTLLASVLHIGDIEFTCSEERGGDSATVSNPELVETICQLLCLDSAEDLSFALTTLRTVTRGEAVDKLYSCSKAAVVRDATAKAVYARMFQWIITRINTHLRPRDNRTRRPIQDDHLNIGILDIFGFENFQANSFEQFCINLANEQLQQYFNHQIFAMEKMECAKEGVDDLDISYTDNTPVIDLFLARPIGLLCLLDEQCKGLNGTEKAFVQRCRESFDKHQTFKPHRGNALEFAVSHYAGDVTYEIDGFIEKNRDSLPDTVVEALRFTNLHLLGILFTQPGSVGTTAGGRTDTLRKSFLRKSQRSMMRKMSMRRRKPSNSPKKKQGNKKLLTVSAHFRESLDLLMERLFAASPHFVRCVKPNLQKQPKMFESEFVLRQLRYTGMLEAVRVRREGYSYRPFFSDFVTSYRAIAYPFTEEDVKLNEATCQVILDRAGLTGWRIARSRVFLRYYHEQRLQLLLKAMEDGAVLIQRIYRGHRTRKMFKPLRDKSRLQRLQVSSLLSQINTHGQIHQPLLKALDRNDILEAPKRFRKRREATAQPPPAQVGPSSSDYDGLSTMQRNVQKAKRFGVKIGVGNDSLRAAMRGQKSPPRNNPRPLSGIKESRPPSEIIDPSPPYHSRPPSGIIDTGPPSESSRPPSEIIDSRPPPEIEESEPTEVSGSPEPPCNVCCDESSRPPPPKNPPPSSKRPVPLIIPSGEQEEVSSPHQPPPSASSLSPSPSHSRTTETKSASLSPFRQSSPRSGSRPTPPPVSPRRKRPPPMPSNQPVPRPRISRLMDIALSANSTASSTVTEQGGNESDISTRGKIKYTPVPRPRTRLRNSADSTGLIINELQQRASDHRRLSESIVSDISQGEMGTPLLTPLGGRRLVGGVKSLPFGDVWSETPERHKDIDSPSSERHLKENENGGTVDSHTPKDQENVSRKRPLVSSASHNLPTSSSDHRASVDEEYSSKTTPRPRRALEVESECCESTLDFTGGGGSSSSAGNTASSRRMKKMSSSVPDLLDEPKTSTTQHTSTQAPTSNGLYPSNLPMSRGLASSADNLLEGTPIERYYGREISDGGRLYEREMSEYSDISAPPTPDGVGSKLEPQQSEKRKGKSWFKRISRKRSGSSDSVGSPTPPPARRDSDSDVLGLYSDLSYENALEMVSGQPKGTYLLFKDDLEVYKGESCVYKLAVSCGREIKVYSILCLSGARGLQYQLVNGAPLTHSPHNSLKTLVNHYKTRELSDGIKLATPRLIAGVAVTGVRITPRQPQMARGKFMKRKKN